MNETIGMIAGFCTTISFVPQIIRIVKTNDTAGISFYMYLIFVIGLLLWLIYGMLIQSNAVIFTNAATFILAGIVLMMKLRNMIFKDKSTKKPEEDTRN
jgi:MtN3 and saliva related transmembrane protein